MSDSDEDSESTVVLDNGSSRLQAGFAGDDSPRCVIPSIVGRSKCQGIDTAVSTTDSMFIGDKAQEKRDILNLSHPIQHGTITNWDDMEVLWRYAMNDQLGIDPDEMRPVLCSDAPMTCKAQREAMIQTMFESLNVPGFYVSCASILVKYAMGRTSDLSVSCGDGVTSVVPHYEGYTSPQAFQRMDVAGCDVTNYLASLLAERGYNFTTPYELDIVREIKEKHCYVAEDYDKELNNAHGYLDDHNRTSFQLPGGETVTLGVERFKAMEALFQPSLLGFHDLPGIHQMVYEAFKMCDIDQRKDLACSFMLSGGSTHCPGFKERLEKELKKLIPEALRVKVIAYPERRVLNAWYGGSILGSLSLFQKALISREEYDEHGPSIVHRCVYLGMW